ncbi:MAG: molybdenum cofactor guanylyltransferase [Pseudomonadota bacterium]|nr:molybdenum cofactor guanylyltransferase [Pseudomonadota bacterium]
MGRHMTGVILSGGKNTRMGANKAFLEMDGERLIDRAVRIYREIFDEIILVTNEPLLYLDWDVAIVTDLEKGKGPLMGIYTGLFWASSAAAFFAACDMPFLDAPFIRYLRDLSRDDVDIVVPETAEGLQPLHAVYSRRCLPAIKARLDRGRLKVTEFYRGMKVRTVPAETVRRFDPCGRMFLNVNTREEFGRLHRGGQPS